MNQQEQIFEMQRNYERQKLIRDMLIQRAQQEQSGQQPQQSGADVVGGLDLASQGASMFSGGSSAAAPAINASYNIPASYLPSVTSTAPEVISSSAAPAAPVPTFGSVLPPVAVAAIAAYTANKGVNAWNKGKGRGAWDGFNEGLQAAGPLKYVPILGQLPALAGMASGIFGHRSTKDRQRERDAKLSSVNADYKSFIDTVNANRANIPDSKFNLTHDVNDLGVNDITGAQVFFENDPNWMKKTEAERNDFAQKLLDAKAIGSKQGMITADFSKLPQPTTTSTPSTVVNPNTPKPTSVQQLTKPGFVPRTPTTQSTQANRRISWR